MENENKYIQYSMPTDNMYVPIRRTIPTLPIGFYHIDDSERYGNYAHRIDKSTKDLFIFPENYMTEIIADIDFFWNNKQLFTDFNFPYKRGLLLYGPPGSGKTSIISLLTNKLMTDYDGLIIESVRTGDIGTINNFLKEQFREIEPNRKIVVIIEDIESYLQNKNSRKELLDLLDGNDTLDNVLFLATTNFVEEIEETISSKPSRFYRSYLIDFPSAENRRFYFEKVLTDKQVKDYDINKLVSLTTGFTIDYMKELIILVFFYNKDLQESVDLLKEMIVNSTKLRTIKSGEQFKKSIGFAKGEYDIYEDGDISIDKPQKKNKSNYR